MTEHTREEVVTALLELVEWKGEDFVYRIHDDAPSCRYADGSNPDCGIGEILHVAFGVPVPYLTEIDNDRIPHLDTEDDDADFTSSIGHPRVRGYLEAIGVGFTDAAMSVMQSFQGYQDMQFPYGDILDRCRLR